MKIKIVADSSCDILCMEEVDFCTAPLIISTDEKDYIDDETLDVAQMRKELSEYKGRSGTACPNIDCWMSCYADADEVYVVTMTSNLSGTYNSAMAAKELYLQEHPDTKIHVFDTLSTGPEMRLLIEKIVEWKKGGIPFETVCEKGTEYLKHTRLFFVLESMHNLVQNGRVSKVAAIAAGVLGIRAMGTASSEGTLEMVAKCRGYKKIVSEYMHQLEKIGYQGGKLRIAHANNLELAETLKNAVQKVYNTLDVMIYETRGLCSFYAEEGGILIGCETI